MALSFIQMAEEAQAEVDGISAEQVHQRLLEDSNAGGVNISLGMLPIRADRELPEEWIDARLQDRSCQIITTCFAGMMSAMGAKVLKDMGFTNVCYMEGGMDAWNAAGLPTD
jgi:rhodanese-related sulfurtransferase